MSHVSPYENNPILANLKLGQKTDYIAEYAPQLLQPVPRQLNRDDLALQDDLPFHGEDIWTLYELSWLNAKGKPVVAIGDAHIPATSKNLIESKSFKLYLNSLNQSRFESMEAVQNILEKDLSACANGAVKVKLYSLSDAPLQIDFSSRVFVLMMPISKSTVTNLNAHCSREQPMVHQWSKKPCAATCSNLIVWSQGNRIGAACI